MIEDIHDATKKAEIDMINEKTEEMNRTQVMNIFEDLYGEREKITFALELAIQEVTKSKAQQEGGDADQDEEAKNEKKEKDKTKNLKKKGFLGVHSVIKLPFVIGTKEFDKHPFAGMVYCGLGSEFEQEDHFKEEEQ